MRNLSNCGERTSERRLLSRDDYPSKYGELARMLTAFKQWRSNWGYRKEAKPKRKKRQRRTHDRRTELVQDKLLYASCWIKMRNNSISCFKKVTSFLLVSSVEETKSRRSRVSMAKSSILGKKGMKLSFLKRITYRQENNLGDSITYPSNIGRTTLIDS